MTAGLGRTLTYTSYNMPAQVVGVGYSGGASTTYNYVYNAEHERTKLVHSTLGTFIYLHPAGKGQLLYEKQTEASPGTRIEHKYYISAGGAAVAVHYARENPNLTETTTAMRYLHQDHLGSITLITNEAGGVTERLAYEAYGKRRYPAGTDDPTNGLFGQVTDRGFTSHEHLDEIALIHMNGRVYDPVLGRFITADPFLQDPGNLQSYNRYSYVLNNPLMYVDPSGYFSLKSFIKRAVTFAVFPTPSNFFKAVDSSPLGGPLNDLLRGSQFLQSIGQIAAAWYGGPWGAAAAADYNTRLNGGGSGDAFKAAIKAYATAVAFDAVGDVTNGHGVDSSYFMTADHIANIAGHAAVGCASAAASGGNCGAGALSAGFGSFATPGVAGWSQIGQLAAITVIGGTASELGGGKFANGAVTAAFGYLFNQAAKRDYVIYERTGPNGECYVGHCLADRFAARQAEHDRATGRDNSYRQLDTIHGTRTDARFTEQSRLNDAGGKGQTENRINAMAVDKFNALSEQGRVPYAIPNPYPGSGIGVGHSMNRSKRPF